MDRTMFQLLPQVPPLTIQPIYACDREGDHLQGWDLTGPAGRSFLIDEGWTLEAVQQVKFLWEAA